ncbi:MAG TPA: DUF4093 domain-containing protein [Ruminococcaceae bacterium]|nr:DUF4093 domain-containing protein [Oscillospiraceae bacterium]
MIKLKQTVIVEGKYDKIRLSSLIDAPILQTDGFAVFKDKEKQKLIRRMAEKNGILILTDSDAAGFKIRSFLSGCVPPELVKHAYIPDILGKERRKSEHSKEGKLGVEGMKTEALVTALTKAGVLCEECENGQRRKITVTDLYEDGLTGCANSQAKKAKLLKDLDLPERLSTSSLLQVLNTMLTFEEYKQAVDACRNEGE